MPSDALAGFRGRVSCVKRPKGNYETLEFGRDNSGRYFLELCCAIQDARSRRVPENSNTRTSRPYKHKMKKINQPTSKNKIKTGNS